ncbi:glycosyltransferase family 2 protein [Salinivibrio sp. EAGSL]|uniref:glycosyltransferase family 2 protein n=1 Tax=Salinivibrio sp. EAGSL TaxID=2738468 RepID=UPI00158AEDDD|nr:glycosyltransferase family 2 protein [Salinivibrio sp. EAGSL]NUY57651.1 glycosyltransferase family 2 protein [Salinivibrio sp. EAGSL]
MITILMPVFNASKFLNESIGSVLAQDYKNWELICIDDQSSDDSLSMLYDFSRKDARIKVYTKENEGPAQARKLGLQHSSGDYVTLLDADDALSPDFLSQTLAVATETDADVVMPVLIQNWKSDNRSDYDFNLKNGLMFKQEIAPRVAFLKTMPWRVHGLNLYKAEHFKKYALSEISNINNYNADEYLTRFLLLYANKIVVSEGKYFYRANNKSITTTFSLRRIGLLKTNEALFNLAKKERFNDEELKMIALHFLRLAAALKYQLLKNKNKLNYSEMTNAIAEINKNYSWHNYLGNDFKTVLMRLFVLFYPSFFSSLLSMFVSIKMFFTNQRHYKKPL